ncbi:MAG: IS110 family transposase [Candidatus Omnitrophota bacterium]
MTQSNQYLAVDYDTFIGIDVDKKSFSFTVKDHYNMNRSKKIPSEPKMFYQYIKKHFSNDRVLCAYEAGPTGFGLYDYLKSRHQPCLVVSPLSIPKAINERVKNNRLDSMKIAEDLRSGQLQSIRVPEDNYRELRHLISLRENYANNRKTAKQRIKSLLLYTDLHKHFKSEEENWSNSYLNKLKELPCLNAERQRLDMLLMDLEYARKQTLSILRQLRQFIQGHEEISKDMNYLQSLPGIGFITAATVLGRIGNPTDLRGCREIGAFLGLVPREKSTGDVVNHGSITQLGNRHLRSMLIEAAWTAIRVDKELEQFYHRIKSRHHPKIAAKKAIVAVARKLTQRIYKVLKEQRVYVVH